MRYVAPLFACCLLAATAASAQTVYVDADRTVAGGNTRNNSASATVNAGRIQSYNGITVLTQPAPARC